MVSQMSHFHFSSVGVPKNWSEAISTTKFGGTDDVKFLSEHCHKGDPKI